MDNTIKKFFDCYDDTPKYDKNNPDYRCSVKYSDFRLNKAKEQAELKPVGIKEIISYVNEFLSKLDMELCNNPIVENPLEINYELVQKANKLLCKEDIVWMKFTKDGHLGVVATSADINFKADNTAGILVGKLDKKWDESFVLMFPLVNIPSPYKRGDIERAIGNYLIHKNVPIIDFYSHNY